ncbi:hypothetical protein PHYSODRAFT_248076 [Phytophthora sojae]|uniref:EF-hand domain-containing protein n=1 Tax=Phytophthora sojae (strain P6497) TaxID=1094619 RepID=G5AGL1_PHYSP|nr:hypothetical protein PHYSODRAFT_248076 [Phytophthora sojae]EGZ05291.1 hypothetical protein PHYSODRAFT_248076 [Phytophthora sojae]|eukprot:XP_009539212.1 hypothetical protein PHYSODRAFT_248076 [Phytophthora sojae]
MQVLEEPFRLVEDAHEGVFRQPALLRVLLGLVRDVRAAANVHVTKCDPSLVPVEGMSAAASTSASVQQHQLLQDCLLVHGILKRLQPLSSESSDNEVAEESRALLYTIVNELLTADAEVSSPSPTRLLLAIHTQGYEVTLVPTLVAHVPGIGRDEEWIRSYEVERGHCASFAVFTEVKLNEVQEGYVEQVGRPNAVEAAACCATLLKMPGIVGCYRTNGLDLPGRDVRTCAEFLLPHPYFERVRELEKTLLASRSITDPTVLRAVSVDDVARIFQYVPFAHVQAGIAKVYATNSAMLDQLVNALQEQQGLLLLRRKGMGLDDPDYLYVFRWLRLELVVHALPNAGESLFRLYLATCSGRVGDLPDEKALGEYEKNDNWRKARKLRRASMNASDFDIEIEEDTTDGRPMSQSSTAASIERFQMLGKNSGGKSKKDRYQKINSVAVPRAISGLITSWRMNTDQLIQFAKKSLTNVLKIIADAYSEMLSATKRKNQQQRVPYATPRGSGRTLSLSQIVYQSFRHSYGLPGIADMHLLAFSCAIETYRTQHLRVEQFVQFCFEEVPKSELTNYLEFLESPAEATSGEQVLNVDHLLQLVIAEWRMEQVRRERHLLDAFRAGDVNGDGQLTSAEFTQIVLSIDASQDLGDILLMYSDTLRRTQCDQLNAEVFLQVAREHELDWVMWQGDGDLYGVVNEVTDMEATWAHVRGFFVGTLEALARDLPPTHFLRICEGAGYGCLKCLLDGYIDFPKMRREFALAQQQQKHSGDLGRRNSYVGVSSQLVWARFWHLMRQLHDAAPRSNTRRRDSLPNFLFPDTARITAKMSAAHHPEAFDAPTIHAQFAY